MYYSGTAGLRSVLDFSGLQRPRQHVPVVPTGYMESLGRLIRSFVSSMFRVVYEVGWDLVGLFGLSLPRSGRLHCCLSLFMVCFRFCSICHHVITIPLITQLFCSEWVMACFTSRLPCVIGVSFGEI